MCENPGQRELFSRRLAVSRCANPYCGEAIKYRHSEEERNNENVDQNILIGCGGAKCIRI